MVKDFKGRHFPGEVVLWAVRWYCRYGISYRDLDYIDQNFSENISLNGAAELAGMSAAAFSRNFQKVMGSTFVEFLNRVRIGKACSMLYTTNEQISVICYEVGFRTLVNFNRQFQKIKNMTPTTYRELAHSELNQKKNAEP